MARKCTVCIHEERIEIEKAMIRSVPYQDIASRFGISAAAAWRHAKSHLAETLAKTTAAREAACVVEVAAEVEARGVMEKERSRDVMKEFGRCFERTNLLFEACDRWLRDPEDPTRYDINPRSEDVWITFVEACESLSAGFGT